MTALGPDDLLSVADSLRLAGKSQDAAKVRQCADTWRLDQAVIDAVLNSDPIRLHFGLFGSTVSCVFCEARARTVEELIHEDYCARLLAEFRRPDL